jgi:hypothetical protein
LARAAGRHAIRCANGGGACHEIEVHGDNHLLRGLVFELYIDGTKGAEGANTFKLPGKTITLQKPIWNEVTPPARMQMMEGEMAWLENAPIPLRSSWA